jgi:hypothetical protein
MDDCDLHRHFPVDESRVYGRALTVADAADAMLTGRGARYELRSELWHGPWVLWIASPEDVAGGRIGCDMARAPFPPIYGPLSEAWPEITDMVVHCVLWPHVPPVTTDEDYVALIEGTEI